VDSGFSHRLWEIDSQLEHGRQGVGTALGGVGSELGAPPTEQLRLSAGLDTGSSLGRREARNRAGNSMERAGLGQLGTRASPTEQTRFTAGLSTGASEG
jgi:hypothetical protein